MVLFFQRFFSVCYCICGWLGFDLVAGVTAVVVAPADIVFDDNYIFVCVAVDVAGLVVALVIVAVDYAGVSTVVRVGT